MIDIHNNMTPKTVTIPMSFIKECLYPSSAEEGKILLLLLANPDKSLSEVASLHGIDIASLHNSVKYWENKGILAINNETGDLEIDFDGYKTIHSNPDPVLSIVHQVEAIIGQPVQTPELQVLMYASKDLSFSDDLVVFLAKYCADRDSFLQHYIRSVADAWKKDNVETVEDAEATTVIYPEEVFQIIDKIGRDRTSIRPSEKNTIYKWLTSYNMLMPLIDDCINESSADTDHKIADVDNTLTALYKKGITTLGEKHRAEKEHSKHSNNTASFYGKKVSFI